MKHIINTIQNQAKKQLTERILSPTVKKYVRWRNVALIIAGVGGALVTGPFALPPALLTVAGILVWGGNTAAGIFHALKE